MADIVSLLNGTAIGGAGTALTRGGTTIGTFAISLAAGFVLFTVQFGIFLLTRNYLWAKRIYQPRSFLVPVKQRIKPPHSNPFKWLATVFRIQEDPEVLERAGMDAYFFLRFLSMCLKIFTPMTVIIMPILIPLNVKQGKSTNTIGGVAYNVTGLDTLAWSNVSPVNTHRYWAHLVLAVAVVAWVCYMFHQELRHYIVKRTQFLSSPAHRLKASSTTVLIQDIPDTLCNEQSLEELYGEFPGGIRRIWINRDFTKLVDKDKLRRSFEDLLENAETDLLRRVDKQSRKGKSLGNRESAQEASERADPEEAQPKEGGAQDPARPEMGPPTPDNCRADLEYDVETKAAWTRFLTPKQRKSMRIPKNMRKGAAKIPLFGRFFAAKVDTIYFCRRELARLNKEIELDVKNPEAYPQNSSAFVQFNSQQAAHICCQSVADMSPDYMRRRKVEISPGDINWDSLNITRTSRYIRMVGFLLLFVVLLFLFGLVSFFTGVLSRLATLSGSTSWLRWVESLPPWLLSFIQGTLPPVILVIVLSGPLPILLRLLTNQTRGATTAQEGERSLQLWYFIFLLVELFLIPTISSGLTSILRELIKTPTSVPNILATNLPTAANYFFSFLIVQALSLSATSILQTIRLFKFYVIGHVNTPDAVFEKLSWTNFTKIGSNVPWYITFAVIGLVYSTIAPLILLFMLITFSLFWVVIKNNLLYCVRTGSVDGGGLFFPNAINQLYIGLYFMEVCIIGLFFLVRDVNGNVACEAQGVIMAIVLICTILYQIWLTKHLGPLFKYAPIRLEIESRALLADYENSRPGTHETENSEAVNSEQQEHKDRVDISENIEDTTIPGLENVSKTVTQDQASQKSVQERPPLWQRHSTNRSTDLKAQKLEDTKSAERILARLNAPLNEARLEHLEKKLAGKQHGIASTLLPKRKDIEAQMLDDPISKIIMQHNDELSNLCDDDRDLLISVAFMHPVLRATKPCVWIPMDSEGVSDDEVRRTREASNGDVVIANRGAYFDKKGKVRVERPPPDMSEFALIMGEL